MKRIANSIIDNLFYLAMVVIVWAAAVAHGATINLAPGANLQAAINQAGVNGTIVLSAGVYPIPARLTMLPGQTIVGATSIVTTPYVDTTTMPGFSIPSARYSVANESVIQAPAGVRAILLANGCTFKNVSIPGSAMHCDRVDGLKIDGCWFDMKSQEAAHPTTSEGWGLFNISITNCVFQSPPALLFDTYIYFYAATGRIANCAFINGRDGIHPANCDPSFTGFTIEECLFAGQRANPVEVQGGGSNFTLKNSWSDAPNYGNPGALMGFSLPADRFTIPAGATVTTRVSGCVVLATGQSNPNNRQRVGFEFAHAGFEVSNTYVTGVRKPVTVTNSQGRGRVVDSCFEDCPEISDTNGPKVAYINVADQSVKRSLLSRGRPGPYRPFVGSNQPPASTLPTTLPVPLPILKITGGSIDPNTGAGTITVSK